MSQLPTERVARAAQEAGRELHARYVHRLLGSPIRSVDGKGMTETFLVCAVATILAIRLFLLATGYPQLGGNGLHVAHLLWGGALMVAGTILMLSLITDASRWVAAVLGGVGFGLFIDEIGKFVTSDNNYFFRPTFALIYVALVIIWLATRALLTHKQLTQTEALANALDLLKEAASRDLNEDQRLRALALLDRSDQGDPLVRQVRELLHRIDTIPTPEPLATTRLLHRLRDWYWRKTAKRWFKTLLTVVFVLLTVGMLARVAELGSDIADAINSRHRSFEQLNAEINHGQRLGFSGWATLASSSIVAVLYSVGVFKLIRRSRLEAYRWFEWGLIVSIFVVQVFDFADEELGAITTLLFNIILLVTLRAMMAEERRRARIASVEAGQSEFAATATAPAG